MAKYPLTGFFFSVVVMYGQVPAPTPVNPEPATAAVRAALARQYERIDAAQSAGRIDEILAIALPGAQGGSPMMRLTLAQHLGELMKVQASSKTEILELNLVGGEALVRTRVEVRITDSGFRQAADGLVATANLWASDVRARIRNTHGLGSSDRCRT